ncbi:MAG: LURP-one-related family protein [Eubacteriaceae bacterium]|nr:LURP-one-related family protein [Eubacteriaceae bacterium]
MKLYIKQKAFSFSDKFYIMDEDGTDRYYVEGEIFTIGKKLHVYDMNGSEVMFLSQRPFTFLPKVDIYLGEELIATVVREISFFTPRFVIELLGWEVVGEFMEHNYEMTYNMAPVATVEKEWFTWGDSYSLEFYDHKDELNSLGILLAIDIINASQAAANAAN